MAKVKNVNLSESVNETPSQIIAKDQNQEFSVVDKRGRRITLKKPGILQQYKLVEILGDSAKNETYSAMIMPLLYVKGIDDLPVHTLATRGQIDALIERLDEDGLYAVAQGLKEHFNPMGNEAEFKDTVKK